VKKLQRALKEAGYSPGAIDGDYGPSTQEAVKKFQTAQHLDADGVYGPKTEVALKKALQTG
jgi:peptidoglycan hydrolase-like protein with peptidoglycan-binding domain